MPYKDIEKKREYQRLWCAKHRQAWIDAQGSKCSKCGRDDLPFEVDHIDRDTKVDHRVWSWAKVRRDEELSKCQLLCQVCHFLKTGEENSGQNLVHGTSTGYRYGCRCELCTEEHSEIMRRYHASVRSRRIGA